MKAVAYGILLVSLLAQASCTTCKGTIGVAYDRSTHKVEYVIAGSPAESIGILPGDTLVEPRSIPGEVGQRRPVTYIRNGVTSVSETELACVQRSW